jgi:predicted ester cyclase
MSDRIERQREIVARHIRGENAHDWETVYDTFEQSSASFYDVIPMHNTYHGIAGVHEFYESIAKAFPDFQIEVKAQYDSPGCSVVEVIVSGTHRGDFFGLVPTGKFVRIPLAGIYLFNEDSTHLLAERVYFDQVSLFAQLPFSLRNAVAGFKLLLQNRKAQQKASAPVRAAAA